MSTKLQDMLSDNHKQSGRLGEIVTWKSPKRVAVTDLHRAMEASGIDKKFLQHMLPKSAFSRACRKLVDNRVIEKTNESEVDIEFQFTQKHLDQLGGRIEYQFETKVKIDKQTGTVECNDPELKVMIERLLRDELGHRVSIDVTRMVQKVIEESGDIFPLRERGGVYLVPDAYRETIDKIDNMFERIGGSMNRYSVDYDGGRNEKGAADAIFGKLSGMVDEFNEYVEEFDGKMTEKRNIKMTSKLNNIQTKFELYRVLLLDKAEELKSLLSDSHVKLEQKITNAMKGEHDDQPVVESLPYQEEQEIVEQEVMMQQPAVLDETDRLDNIQVDIPETELDDDDPLLDEKPTNEELVHAESFVDELEESEDKFQALLDKLGIGK